LIPEVVGVFQSLIAMVLGSARPLTKMSTRNISWGEKAAGYVGLTTFAPSLPIALKSENFNLEIAEPL
jgi:hypothetical protein